MTEMQRCQAELFEKLPVEFSTNYQDQAKEYMRFQIQIVKSLKLRSESNQERLKNEINLVNLDPMQHYRLVMQTNAV
jgi:hypothetical protein